MNKTLNNEFLVFLLLYSLPLTPSWETFKSSVLNSLPTNSKLSFENVSDCLLTEVTCTKGDSTAVGTVESAMKASKWCDLHKTSMHSNKECHTQKQKEKEKSGKKRKWKPLKKKGREKAHKVDSDTGSTSKSEELSGLDSDHGHKPKANTAKATKAGPSNTERAHVSKALMKSLQLYLAVQPLTKVSKDILVNSGASSHMTPHHDWFIPSTYKTVHPPVRIYLSDDSVIDAIGTGTVQFWHHRKDGTLSKFHVSNVLHSPALLVALISVQKLTKTGHKLIFDDNVCLVKSKSLRQVVAEAHLSHGNGPCGS